MAWGWAHAQNIFIWTIDQMNCFFKSFSGSVLQIPNKYKLYTTTHQNGHKLDCGVNIYDQHQLHDPV